VCYFFLNIRTSNRRAFSAVPGILQPVEYNFKQYVADFCESLSSPDKLKNYHKAVLGVFFVGYYVHLFLFSWWNCVITLFCSLVECLIFTRITCMQCLLPQSNFRYLRYLRYIRSFSFMFCDKTVL